MAKHRYKFVVWETAIDKKYFFNPRNIYMYVGMFPEQEEQLLVMEKVAFSGIHHFQAQLGNFLTSLLAILGPLRQDSLI